MLCLEQIQDPELLRQAARLLEVRRELLTDIGGPAAVSAQQMILVDRAAGLLLHADTWRKWLEESGRDPGDPVVDRVCGRYLSCERELRETLKALGLDRKKRPPSPRSTGPSGWRSPKTTRLRVRSVCGWLTPSP